MSDVEIIAFLQNPFALEAVDLRRFDDLAKRDERLNNRAQVLSVLRELCESCAHD